MLMLYYISLFVSIDNVCYICSYHSCMGLILQWYQNVRCLYNFVVYFNVYSTFMIHFFIQTFMMTLVILHCIVLSKFTNYFKFHSGILLVSYSGIYLFNTYNSISGLQLLLVKLTLYILLMLLI